MLYKIRLKPFREQKFTLSFHTFTEKVCTYASTAFFKWTKQRPERRTHYTPAAARRSQKKYRPAADPLPGAQDGKNLTNWRWSLPSPSEVHTQSVFVRSTPVQAVWHWAVQLGSSRNELRTEAIFITSKAGSRTWS